MTRPGGRLVFALLTCSPLAAAAPPGRAERCAAMAERGQQERDRAAFTEARDSFRACASDECPSLVRKDCAQWLADVEENTPTVVLGARDARGNDLLDAHILIDGAAYDGVSGRSIPLDPGPHLFQFSHPPDAPLSLTVVLRTGEHNRLVEATLGEPPPPPAPRASPPPPLVIAPAAPRTRISPWAYASSAVAVAGVASFAVFGTVGLEEKSHLRAQCGDRCSDAQVAPLKAEYITADASLGVGVVAAAVAIWLFTHPAEDPKPDPPAALSVTPSRQGLGVSLVERF